MILSQIFEMINIGLVVLDGDLRVRYWNRWMELHSSIEAGQIVGTHLFDSFPEMNTSRFLRNCKSILKLGNFCFFSQKLHHFLFPFKPVNTFDSRFDYMQQSCTMGPLRDENSVVKYIFITIQDVTEVVAYEQKLVDMNSRDGLTGIYNRRFLEVQLVEELERFTRYSRPFSVLMLDIDFFKRINDTYGHQCGDFVLRFVAEKLDSCTRKNIDFVARYGGEEFCFVLPETGLESALSVAERLREMIARQEITYRDLKIKLSVSVGVAAAVEGIRDTDTLLSKADEALYEAKMSGRNRVAVMKPVQVSKGQACDEGDSGDSEEKDKTAWMKSTTTLL